MRLPQTGQIVIYKHSSQQFPAIIVATHEPEKWGGEVTVDLVAFTIAGNVSNTDVHQGSEDMEWQWPDIALN